MKWTARLRFGAGVACRLTRYAVGAEGDVRLAPLATPYCPDGILMRVQLVDPEGRIFQVGTDAIDLRAELPANTGSGMRLRSNGEFFDAAEGSFKWVEDSLASRVWESDPFEIDTDFRPSDLQIGYWLVPSPDGTRRKFIDCENITYCHRPLKMNVTDKGYRALADVSWFACVGKDKSAEN